ncbi:MAG: methyltransferase domain-containing protein [Chloroflexota bacterium]|nr:methyltransferase domain-containing protein [Chloroflexota bacterium]
MAWTSFLPRPLLPTPPHSDAVELLDAPATILAPTLAHNLRDIRRVNRFAGGTAVVLRHLRELLDGVSRGTTVSLLDIATGSGDIPRALVRWGRQQNYDLRVLATDVSEDVLAVARRETADVPTITIEACDARALPYRDGAFDIAICSLALHHFPRAEAVRVLAEMGRVSRRGIILNDLVRTWSGYVGAWLLGNATTTNRLTRHDAPLSILRAFTPDELAVMAREAGLTNITVTSHLFWRMALVARRPS